MNWLGLNSPHLSQLVYDVNVMERAMMWCVSTWGSEMEWNGQTCTALTSHKKAIDLELKSIFQYSLNSWFYYHLKVVHVMMCCGPWTTRYSQTAQYNLMLWVYHKCVLIMHRKLFQTADPLLVSPIASPGLHPIPFSIALPNSAIGRES